MTVLFTGSYVTILDTNGSPVSGAKCHFYEAGTSTPITTYSDSALSAANTNPVVADSAGRLGSIFLAADDYKVYITDSEDNEIDTQDNYAVQDVATFTSKRTLNAQTGTTYTIQTTDRSKLLTFSNASAVAVTLPEANSVTFPDGWYAEVKNKGAGTVTITSTTSTIDTKTTLTLPTGYGATIYSDSTNYQIQGFYRLDTGTNAQTGTSYTILTGDRNRLITLSNASAIAVSLPQANSTTFEDGWKTKIRNLGAGVATVTPTTSTINSQSSIALGTGQAVEVVSDGTNYDITYITGDEGTDGQVLTSNGAGVLPTFQNAFSPFFQGGYITNKYYGGGRSSSSAVTMVADVLMGGLYHVTKTATFTRIGLNVSSSSTATAARIGIYNFADGVPTSLVLDCGTVPVGTTGNKEITISQELSTGTYVVAVVADGGVGVNSGSTTDALQALGWGQEDATTENRGVEGSHAYAALPSTFPSVTYINSGTTRTNAPFIWMRVV